jgi:hypothetical protein
MPRYYFDPSNGQRLPDPSGLECRDDDEAKAKAEVIARQVAAEAPAKGGGPPGTFIDRRICLPKEATMPRFYFNFRNSNEVAEDKEGMDLPSLEEARRTALESARELVAEHIKADSKTPLEAVIVTDAGGREILTVPARDVLPDPLKK